MSRLSNLLLSVSVLMAPSQDATASSPRAVWLDVSRDAGAMSCLDAAAARTAVTGRLGHDPFDEGSPDRITVDVRRVRAGFVARVTLAGAATFRGERTLKAAGPGCEELGELLVLALSVAIDPLSVYGPAQVAPLGVRRQALSTPARRPVVRRSPEASPAPSVEPSRVDWFVSLGVSGGLGLTPGPSVGPTAGLGFTSAGWRASMELGVQLLGQRDLATGGEVEADLLSASLVGCVTSESVDGCVFFAAGAALYRGAGDAASTEAFFAPGIRWVGRLGVSEDVNLTIGASAWFPLTRATLVVNGADAWTTPVLAGSATLGVELML